MEESNNNNNKITITATLNVLSYSAIIDRVDDDMAIVFVCVCGM